MAAPNIDMIAASLRSCSLAGKTAPSPAPAPFRVVGRDLPGEGAAAASADTTLDLNSDVALPYHWEQCLDLKTGKIYYINWSTGAKSMEDPRKFAGFGGDGYFSEDEDDDRGDGDEADDENDEDEDEGEGDDSSEDGEADSDEYGNCSSAFSSSSLSSGSSRDTIERGGTGRGAAVLVAAGCRICMMYVMIPKRAEECPRCGGRVLHFSRSGGR